MIRTIKMCLAVGGALAMAACGPGAKLGGGKQGAAEALYAAGAPAASSTNAGQPINISLTGDTTVSCRYGGTASLQNFALDTSTTSTGANVGAKFTLAYNKCGAAQSSAGVAVFDGSYDVTQAIVADPGAATVKQSFKGKVTVSGAFDDFLQADITEDVDAQHLTATTGSVSVSLVGTLSDSSGDYTYNESVDVTANNLQVQATATSTHQ
jgi:hypothetical protein